MPQMPAALEVSQIIRHVKPESKQILGGPQVTMLNASAKLELQRGHVGRASAALQQLSEAFDVLVAGDGERAIFNALAHDAPWLIDADRPDSELFLKSVELDRFPLPARSLIDLNSYKYAIDGLRTHSMIAQLGCPFGCNFCGGRRSPFLRRVRMRSTDEVLREVRHLYNLYGTRGVMFLDDELNVNPRFIELLRGLIGLRDELGAEFRFRGLVKSELLTHQQAELMYEAGFRQLLIGFESGDPRMLGNMNKHATVSDNSRCVDICKDHGIRVKALMSFGHPGESVETIENTRSWLLKMQPDDFDVTIITIYPGTPYYDDSVERDAVWTYTAKNGDRLHSHNTDQFKDVNFYKGVPHNYQSFVWTDALSAKDLVQLRDEVEDGVRRQLGIPYPTSNAALNFEHSMGMK
jgi:radical SAM superfamily enzyme YgiQ (UPF0313 family)